MKGIPLNMHLVLAHTINGPLISPMSALLPELLGATPTKALNDKALKENISLCLIPFFRFCLAVEPALPYTCKALTRHGLDKKTQQVQLPARKILQKRDWLQMSCHFIPCSIMNASRFSDR